MISSFNMHCLQVAGVLITSITFFASSRTSEMLLDSWIICLNVAGYVRIIHILIEINVDFAQFVNPCCHFRV